MRSNFKDSGLIFVSQKEFDIDHKLFPSFFVSFSLYALHKIVEQKKKKKILDTSTLLFFLNISN